MQKIVNENWNVIFSIKKKEKKKRAKELATKNP